LAIHSALPPALNSFASPARGNCPLLQILNSSLIVH
jgi:hypothetical protein